VTPAGIAIIALTGLVCIVGVAALVADRGRRQWAARCAERTAERDRLDRDAAHLARRLGTVQDQRDAAHDLIRDLLPHLKHAGASPGLKRRAADLLDGT
jgi:hypothetical protein